MHEFPVSWVYNVLKAEVNRLDRERLNIQYLKGQEIEPFSDG